MKITYAIGDVHGQAEALSRLLELIKEDMLSYSYKESEFRVIQMGDIINRGPHSFNAVEICKALPRIFPEAETYVLRGDHEDWTTSLYNGNAEGVLNWISADKGKGGGLATLKSYGHDGNIKDDDPDHILSAIQKYLHKGHIEYFSGLPTYVSDDSYFFVHAGIVPGVPLTEQSEEDFVVLHDHKKEKFLQSDISHGKVIVHGHTPVDSGEILHNRVNTDAGAAYNKELLCAVLPEVYNQNNVRTLRVKLSC